MKLNAIRRAAARPITRNLALIAGLFLAGGLCGVAAHQWIGGLQRQHAQLEQCVVGSRNSHSMEDARSRLAHLELEVPLCMDRSGYRQALDNKSCDPALWQGNVFCYLPKNSLGRLVYRLEVSSRPKSLVERVPAPTPLTPPILQPPHAQLEAREP